MPRKKPFSGKQKKQQLQAKKERKKKIERLDEKQEASEENTSSEDGSSDETRKETKPVVVAKLHEQPVKRQGHDPNRYKLHFEVESEAELEKRKLKAKRNILKPLPEEETEYCVLDFYPLVDLLPWQCPGHSFPPIHIRELDIPKRPMWSGSDTKEDVEQRERMYFEKYLERIHSWSFGQHWHGAQLSYFEHNLETWRQLWRVLERSNIICIIGDVRFAPIHFPLNLYEHIKRDLGKPVVYVLNKVDLVPPDVVVAWREYFEEYFPSLHVICFTSHPDPEVSLEPQAKVHLKFKRRKLRLSAVGPKELFKVVTEIYSGSDIDLSDWEAKLEPSILKLDRKSETASMSHDDHVTSTSSAEITIGMVGYPNAGKSSIINGILGKKAVSVSRTPGHTKHFQTIYLTPSVVLCDCPGLVFPSIVERQLQVLTGIYPISQVREPYSVVGYLAERVPMTTLLRLVHPDQDDPHGTISKDSSVKDPSVKNPSVKGHWMTDQKWTAWDICDAWAVVRKYFTAKGARYDTYRAANSLLRLACDGRICFYISPHGFYRNRDKLQDHPDVKAMIELQKKGLPSSSSAKRESSDSENQSESSEGEESGGVTLENKFTALLNMST